MKMQQSQFQPGLSMGEFLDVYGTELRCHISCSTALRATRDA
jgi:hypothetical protein